MIHPEIAQLNWVDVETYVLYVLPSLESWVGQKCKIPDMNSLWLSGNTQAGMQRPICFLLETSRLTSWWFCLWSLVLCLELLWTRTQVLGPRDSGLVWYRVINRTQQRWIVHFTGFSDGAPRRFHNQSDYLGWKLQCGSTFKQPCLGSNGVLSLGKAFTVGITWSGHQLTIKPLWATGSPVCTFLSFKSHPCSIIPW